MYLFLNGAIKIVYTTPWPHYPNENVFSDAGICCTMSPPLSGAMETCFQTTSSTENALSPKALYVRVTMHVCYAYACTSQTHATDVMMETGHTSVASMGY